MRRKPRQGVLMGVGLAAVLTVGVGAWGVASAASQAQAQMYAGQVREIDHCGLEPGTYAGSLMLAQAGAHQVDLAIPEGTTIQRENECVHLEQLGVGNYVVVQATPLLPEWVGPYAISWQGNRTCQPKKGGLVCQAKPLSPSPQGHSRDWTWDKIDAYQESPIQGN
jgi:hypothetical protein